MTKTDFKSRVKGLFSVRWLKNNGEEGYIHRGILGGYAWRHTNNPVPNNLNEHENYVLVYRVGNGLLPQHRRWANVNPNTITQINGVAV